MWKLLILTLLLSSSYAEASDKICVNKDALETVLRAFQADRTEVLYLQLLYEARQRNYLDTYESPVDILLQQLERDNKNENSKR